MAILYAGNRHSYYEVWKMFAFLGALAGGLLSVAGGVAGAAASMATSVLSGAAGVVSGAGGLLFAAPVTIGQRMAEIAEPGYYEAAGAAGIDILGGVASATSKTTDYLGNILPTAAGIYQLVSPAKKIEALPAAKAVPTAPAPIITKSQLPILGTQAPMILTTGAVAKPEPNYILYIGLAILVLFLLRKK